MTEEYRKRMAAAGDVEPLLVDIMVDLAWRTVGEMAAQAASYGPVAPDQVDQALAVLVRRGIVDRTGDRVRIAIGDDGQPRDDIAPAARGGE